MMKALLAIAILILAVCVAAQERGKGTYTCINSTRFSWTSTKNERFTIDCPHNTECQFTSPETFPCVQKGKEEVKLFKYECDETLCIPPTCQCASRKPPGNLEPSRVPQMITLTFDDSITPTSLEAVRKILDYGHKNPNGCDARITWFVSWDITECSLVPTYVELGHEIAIHTVNHNAYPPIDEIEEARILGADCGKIPKCYITGFRAPYLQSASWTYDALVAMNITYFSSDADGYADVGDQTRIGNKLWPYTLDYGMYGQCFVHCDDQARHPGLWSIPMNTIDDLNPGSTYSQALANMDPPFEIPKLRTLYWENFLRHYNGNRAPFGIWVHPAWLNEDRINWVNEFLSQALKLPDVYVVSMQDVITYMKNPVAVDSEDPMPFHCPRVTDIENAYPCVGRVITEDEEEVKAGENSGTAFAVDLVLALIGMALALF